VVAAAQPVAQREAAPTPHGGIYSLMQSHFFRYPCFRRCSAKSFSTPSASRVAFPSASGLDRRRGGPRTQTELPHRRLETGPRHQQNCTECHKEKARPVRSEPQESQAAPWRLQSAANRPGGTRAAKRSPPNSRACHVQDSAENEQRAKPHQEHSRLLNSSLPRTTELESIAGRADSFRKLVSRTFSGTARGDLSISCQLPPAPKPRKSRPIPESVVELIVMGRSHGA
jgi:hypothetical protein